MLLPSLNAGTMYHLHQGTLQEADGQISKSRSSRSTLAAATGQSARRPWPSRPCTSSDTWATPTSLPWSQRKSSRAERQRRGPSRTAVCSTSEPLPGDRRRRGRAVRDPQIRGRPDAGRAGHGCLRREDRPGTRGRCEPFGARRPSCCTHRRCRPKRTWPSPRPSWHARSISIRPCDCDRRPA